MKITLVDFFKRMKYSFRKSGKSKKKKNGKNKKTGKDGRPHREEGMEENMEGLARKRAWKVWHGREDGRSAGRCLGRKRA